MDRIVTKRYQEFDGLGRDSGIGQESHASLRAERVHFVVSERRGVRECLADVFLFKVRQLLDNLRRGHPVGDHVDNVCHRDAEAANGRSPGEKVGVLCNSLKCIWHDSPQADSIALVTPLQQLDDRADLAAQQALRRQVRQERDNVQSCGIAVAIATRLIAPLGRSR